jgi:hypothetical protein
MSYTITESPSGFVVTDKQGTTVLMCAKLWIALSFLEKQFK